MFGFVAPIPVPNDSIPLFCVSEGVWRGTNRQGNEYELTRALIGAGAEVEIGGGLPLASAVSFDVIRAVEALLDAGAIADGVDRDGLPMAYAMVFGFGAVAELLAERGAQLDLRFAAGLGWLELVKSWFSADGSLKPGAGSLADPYGLEWKRRGQSVFRCERTRRNILSQALYFACVHSKVDVADFLLSQGADINAIVPGLDVRATVLHRMATMDAYGYTVIRFLLARGASPEIRDEQYHRTPADWARYHKREDVGGSLAIASGVQRLRFQPLVVGVARISLASLGPRAQQHSTGIGKRVRATCDRQSAGARSCWSRTCLTF